MKGLIPRPQGMMGAQSYFDLCFADPVYFIYGSVGGTQHKIWGSHNCETSAYQACKF